MRKEVTCLHVITGLLLALVGCSTLPPTSTAPINVSKTPPPSNTTSSNLRKALDTYRTNLDLEAFVYNLSNPNLGITHTSFQDTLIFLEHGLPVLARAGQTSLALRIVDKIFEIYGPVDSIFQKIQAAYEHSPLQSSLLLERPQSYKTPALSGLIYGEQIIALYDQIRFSEVKQHGTLFLNTYAQHPLASKITSLVDQAKQKIEWKGLRIALLLPLSGPHAQAGNDIMEGIFYSFHVFDPENTSSSDKLPFEFFPIDTHAHSHDLVEKVSQLIQDESIFLIVGPYLAQTHKKIVPIAQKHRVPLLSLAPIEQSTSDASSLIVMRPSLTYQLQFIVDYINNHIQPISNLATLYPDNSFGHFHATAFQHAADRTGKTLSAAEMYHPGLQKTYKPAAEKLLGVFDLQDRGDERKSFSQTYEENHGKAPRSNQIELSPMADFELLYIPSPIRDASILAPLFKYLSATHFIILGPPFWNKEDMIFRTQPFLENVILFDLFYEAETHPAYVDVAQKFKQKYNRKLNQDSFLGKLVGDIILKTLSQVTQANSIPKEDFLEQIQQVKGRTCFGQEWSMTPAGILHLDPIPLAFQKNTFTRINEEMVAKIRETVFAIKIHESTTEKLGTQ